MPKEFIYTNEFGNKRTGVVPSFYTEEQIEQKRKELRGEPSVKELENQIDPEETVPVNDEPTSDQPSTGDVLQGVGLEIGAAISGQAAGAALAPLTFGASWFVGSFAGGYTGSALAQAKEGREDFSYGRAIAAGLVNMVPFGNTLKSLKATAAATGQTLTKGQVVKELAKTEAKRGAAIAGTEVTVSSLIDKQELPSASEFLGISAVGAVGGGTIGSGIAGISNVMARWGAKNIASKTPEQIDADIANDVIKSDEAAKFVNLANPTEEVSGKKVKIEAIARTEKNDAKNVLSKTLGSPSRLFKMFEDKFIPKGEDLNGIRKFYVGLRPTRYTGRDVKEADWTYTNEVRALEQTGSKIANRVRKYSEANKGSEQHINNYLDTGVVHSSLANKSIMGDLKYARDIIPEYSNHFIRQIDNFSFSKINKEGQEALIKEVNDNLAKKKYYTQEYEIYTNKDWRPDVKKKNAAVEEVYKNLKNAQTPKSRKTDAQLRKEAALTIRDIEDNALYNAPTKSDATSVSPDSGILKGKKLNPETNPKQMEYMGLITDPSERIRGTITKLGKIVARNEADIAIAKSLGRSGIATPNKPNYNAVPLKLPSGLETGLYVPNDVQFSLYKNYIEPYTEKSGDMTTDFIRDAWFTSVSTSKAAKVIFNLPSYAVNFFGGVFTMAGMGMNPFRGGGYTKGLKIALSEYAAIEKKISGKTASEREALIRLMNDASKYGLSSGNVDVSDIRNGLQNKEGLAGFADKAIQPFAKAYQSTDIAARYSVWFKNQERLSKMFPDLKGDDLKLASAKLTNDTFQNYEKLSPVIKALSRYGAMPQFVAFTAEFTRNIYNQAKFAKQMIQGNFGQELGIDMTNANREVMRAEGVKRMTSLIAILGAAEGGRRGWNYLEGITSEEEKALRESVVPDFDSNKSLAFKRNKNDPNDITYMNMSYLLPHSMFAEGFNAAISDKPLSSISNVFLENFTGEGSFVFQSVARGLTNKDKYDRPISKQPEGSAAMRGELVAEVVNEIWKLGTIREFDKLTESLLNKESKYTPLQVGKRQLGFRSQSYELKESATRRVKQTSVNVTNLKNEYNGRVKGGRLTEGQRNDLYNKNNTILKNNVDVLINHKNNLSNLEQLETDDVVEILKDTGLDSLTVLGIMEDQFIPMDYEPAVNISDIFDELSTAAKENNENVVKKIIDYSDDPFIRKKLISRFNQDVKDKALGLSSVDRLIKGLSADKQVRYFEIKGDAEFKRASNKGLIKKETFIKRIRGDR